MATSTATPQSRLSAACMRRGVRISLPLAGDSRTRLALPPWHDGHRPAAHPGAAANSLPLPRVCDSCGRIHPPGHDRAADTRPLRAGSKMKLLHTSDWHLGRVTYNQSRAPDDDAVLAEIHPTSRGRSARTWSSTPATFSMSSARAIPRHRAWPRCAPRARRDRTGGRRRWQSRFARPLPHLPEASRAVRAHPLHRQASGAEDGGILDYPLPNGERIRLAPLPFIHQNRFIEGFSLPETWSGQYADQVHAIESMLGKGLADGADYASDILALLPISTLAAPAIPAQRSQSTLATPMPRAPRACRPSAMPPSATSTSRSASPDRFLVRYCSARRCNSISAKRASRSRW